MLPTIQARDNTVRKFENCFEIIKNGMFFGINAPQIAEALDFLHANIEAMKNIKTQEDLAKEQTDGEGKAKLAVVDPASPPAEAAGASMATEPAAAEPT